MMSRSVELENVKFGARSVVIPELGRLRFNRLKAKCKLHQFSLELL